MATGPQHYKKAEDLVAAAAEQSPHSGDHYWTREERALMLAEAQVHATLAEAAARVGGFMSLNPLEHEGMDWSEVLVGPAPKIVNHGGARGELDLCTSSRTCPAILHVAGCPLR